MTASFQTSGWFDSQSSYWFETSCQCPMCRIDIRDTVDNNNNNNNLESQSDTDNSEINEDSDTIAI